ncbi:membrane protein [Youhaiella tibetensis]|uniref:NfeD family protein n=1 Tax=Paradevosia tibetensis TaxID=1447062 RepID=A0A5B9DS52_9HYPH|nr:NfeD family protein [Youhaiella tibetensis]QEE22027.1 NfeD family protein [Youhaiella tibetensis]GGF46024.1 membrane protein [Youhaiella tibetensis]
MHLLDWIATYGAWAWVVGGVILLALELALPGGVFVWLGSAAVVTGLVSLVYPLDWAFEFAFFAVLALLAIFVWLRFFRHRIKPTDNPFLNQRASRFIGQELVLDEAITAGFGRVSLGDSVWRISGPDLPAGARIRIVGAEGAVLKVEQA